MKCLVRHLFDPTIRIHIEKVSGFGSEEYLLSDFHNMTGVNIFQLGKNIQSGLEEMDDWFASS
jgi:hypothetical protein